MDRPLSPPTPPSLAADAPPRWIGIVTLALLIVGGLNWGLVGLFDFDLVARLFGGVPLLMRAVYVIVGAAAVAAIFLMPRLLRAR